LIEESVLQRTLQTALQHGGDFAEVFAEDRRSASARLDDAKVEEFVSGRERATRAAARLGAAWGLGHALTLVAFGLPILLAERYLPELVQRGAETTVAALIAFLAVRLLVRWRHGAFAMTPGGGHGHVHRARTPAAAFGIGLVHGMGGSAGVGVLLLAAIPSTALAVTSLVVLAFFTAVSMTMVTTGFGATTFFKELRVQPGMPHFEWKTYRPQEPSDLTKGINEIALKPRVFSSNRSLRYSGTERAREP